MNKYKHIIKKFIFFIIFFAFNNNLKADEIQTKVLKEQEQQIQDAQDNKILKFFKKWIVTPDHPIFYDQKHMIYLFLGYNHNSHYYSYEKYQRSLFYLSLTYGIKNDIFGIKGKFSAGFFYMFGTESKNGKQHGIIYNNRYKYNCVGIEGYQEIILGNKYIYITAGLGGSYIFYNGEEFAGTLPVNSLFNFVITTSIGHSFKNGLVLEARWKHYSNGELNSLKNYGMNFLGLSVGYVFA